MRTESRGAHYREDFPHRDDAAVAQANAGDLAERARHLADAGLRAARRQARWSCRPGWRGYGAKDYVDHPDTARAEAEVAALRERLEDAPRFARAAGADALRPICCRDRCAGATNASTSRCREDRHPPGRRELLQTGACSGRRRSMPHARRSASCASTRSEPEIVPRMAELRTRGSRRHDAVHRPERDPRKARPVAAVRLRLPRRHLRQLRACWSTAVRRSPAAR